jgi:hypothetical protein
LIGSVQEDFARGIDIIDRESAIETGLIAIAKHDIRSGRDNERGAHGNDRRGVIVAGGVGNGPPVHVDARQARIVHFKPLTAHIFGAIGIVHDFGNDQDGGRIGGKDGWWDLPRRLGRPGWHRRRREGTVIGSTGRTKVSIAVASRSDAPIGTHRIVQCGGALLLAQGHAGASHNGKSRSTPIHDIHASSIGIQQEQIVAAGQAHFAPRINVIDAWNATIHFSATARAQYGIAIGWYQYLEANHKRVVTGGIGNAPAEQIDGPLATIVQFNPLSPYILNLGWIGHDFIKLEAIAIAVCIGQFQCRRLDRGGSTGSGIHAVIGSTGRAIIATTKGTATRCAPMGTNSIV